MDQPLHRVSNRRSGYRVPFEVFLDQYIRDRPYRGLTTDISPAGVSLRAAIPALSHAVAALQSERTVALEVRLPGISDSIWARGEVCYQTADSLALTRGIRFTAMARAHARLLRDFCIETRREQLGSMLARMMPGTSPRSAV